MNMHSQDQYIQINKSYQMMRTLEQIIISQTKQQLSNVYVRLQSQEVFVSTTTQLGAACQAKFDVNMMLSDKLPLKIEVWNYEPHKLLKSWFFERRKIVQMKNKLMLSQNNRALYLKKTEKLQKDKQNKLLRANKSNFIDRDSSNFKLKINQSKIKSNKIKRDQIKSALQSNQKSNKDNIKKTLKNTIKYLIKQQRLVRNFEHYGMQVLSSKCKTGKCTPSSQQISNIRGHSTLFSEYGLNMTDLNNAQEKGQLLSFKLELKKKISNPR